MLPPPEPLQAFESATYNVRLSICMGVAGYAVMMYDHVLTFADEVQYVWRAQKTPVAIMFLLNRYVTPIVLAIDLYDKGGASSYISHDFCITWYYIEAALYVCSFAITHVLIALRVAAMWGRPRWIIVLLSLLWFIYFSITFTIVFKAASSKAYTVHFEPMFQLCYLTISPILWTCWIPSLVLELVFFTLSSIQVYRAGRYTPRTSVLYVLFRDGTLHFLVIVFCSLFNMITWIIAPPTLVALAKYFSIAIINVMISRLVLNLRSCQKSPHLAGHQRTPRSGAPVEVEMSVPPLPLDVQVQV